jgi:hypothetical protein
MMCFAHALFNADEMISKGYEVRIVLEGQSTGLIPALASEIIPSPVKGFSQVRSDTSAAFPFIIVLLLVIASSFLITLITDAG